VWEAGGDGVSRGGRGPYTTRQTYEVTGGLGYHQRKRPVAAAASFGCTGTDRKCTTIIVRLMDSNLSEFINPSLTRWSISVLVSPNQHPAGD